MEMLNLIIDDIPNISVITKIEVLRFNTSDKVYSVLQSFINESTVFELTEDVVNKTISVCKAHKIKLPDAVIAATALVNDLTLVTRNVSDFKSIENLELNNPWEPV